MLSLVDEVDAELDKPSGAEWFGVLILSLIFDIPIILLRGFVISKLWAWFIVTTFGLPILTVGAALGLSVMVNFLTKRVADTIKPKKGELIGTALNNIFGSIINSLSALLIGWVISLFL